MRAVLAIAVLCLSLSTANASASLSGINPRLANKVQDIGRVCGSKVVSTVRPGAHVAGTHRMSLHAYGKAVDIVGNPRCIYAQLKGWRGGYSVDYGRVHHVHVSLGGREDGRRFTHRTGGHRQHYAKRHHRRFARA